MLHFHPKTRPHQQQRMMVYSFEGVSHFIGLDFNQWSLQLSSKCKRLGKKLKCRKQSTVPNPNTVYSCLYCSAVQH